MGDPIRKYEQYSPKNSPRGGRSPVVPRQDSSGTLKATISLGKNPSIVHSGPFYLIKEPATESELTGGNNLMLHYGLEHSYKSGRKIKDTLSSFLPNLPGIIDSPANQDNSSLRSVIDKPPIGGKEFLPLNSMQLSGFRLHPGLPLPETYRLNQPQKKKKHKRHSKSKSEILQPSTTVPPTPSSNGGGGPELTSEKKHKKQKRDKDEEKEKERRKRKKEKKKKKQKEFN